VQAIELLSLHKIQEMILVIQNIKLTYNKQKSKPKTQRKTQQKPCNKNLHNTKIYNKINVF
jgi:hypothetical protein